MNTGAWVLVGGFVILVLFLLGMLELVRRLPNPCIICGQDAGEDGLCNEHGGLPFNEWPQDAQDRLMNDLKYGGHL